MLKRSLRCVAFLLLSISALAQSQTTVLRIPRITRPPKLSDFLHSVPREAEVAVTEFVQWDPTDGAPATQKTTAYLSYDDKNFYIGWVCEDDPSRIRARIARRKDIGNDDRVSLSIDTFHDHKNDYWFEVNPYGIQTDGRSTDGQGDDFNFEALWYSEAKLTLEGYVVLQTIPFRSLRFTSSDIQSWGITLGRFIARNNEWDFWPHISRTRFPQWVGQFGDMEIKEKISPGRNIQFNPYGLFSSSRYLDPTSGFGRETQARAGLDTKMVIRNSLSLDFTVNPDFSQVESDEPQVTVNQRYEVVYPEKRPFFMENTHVFNTPDQLFFSRRIVDPQFGARITGTLGRWSVGALAADDRAPGKELEKDDPLYNKRAIDAVFRLERAFGKQSHLGAMITSRDFGASSNRIGSLDVRISLARNWALTGQATTTRTRFADGSSLAGPSYNASIRNSGEHFDFTSGYTDISPGFRADLGYIQRTNIRQWANVGSYRWRPRQNTLTSFGPSLWQLVNWNREGHIQDWAVIPQFGLGLRRLTSFLFSRTESFELYRNIGFRKSKTGFSLQSEPYKWLAFNTEFDRGIDVNYYPGTDLQPFLANSTYATLGLTLRPQPRLRLDQSYIYNRLGTDAKSLPPSVPHAGPIFNNHIIRSKANYQFTRELSVRAIVDYNSLLANPALMSSDGSPKRIGTDVLLTYFLHPGTAFYAGYSDTLENATYDSLQSPAYRRTVFPGTNTGRQFFVKMSYLFRY